MNKDYYRLNFDKIIKDLAQTSAKSQITFLYKLIMVAGPSMCRTIIRYCHERLDRINAALPDDDPNKIRFLERVQQGKSLLTQPEIESISIANPRIVFQEEEKL